MASEMHNQAQLSMLSSRRNVVLCLPHPPLMAMWEQIRNRNNKLKKKNEKLVIKYKIKVSFLQIFQF